MKKHRYAFLIITLFIHSICTAQSWQWAFTTGGATRSQTVAVKQSPNGGLFLASYTDSVSTHVSTQIEVWDPNVSPIYQFQIPGNAVITDLEINANNDVVVVGHFTGSITIDTSTLTSITPADNSGFIFEMSYTGSVHWAHDLNPVNGDFKTGDLHLASDGTMYLTSQVSGNFGFTAFHQLDAQGYIIRNEFNNNFDNRSYTNIITDSIGNVYMSGTCGNGAMFDSIAANPNFSYQNFLVKYDSTLKAQWLITRNYITFDDNNNLATANQNLYWVFDDFSASTDTVKIIKCDFNGQIITENTGPVTGGFFPSLNFAMDRFGNSVLAINTFARIFVYRYDAAFNLIWQDTLLTQFSGFPFHNGLVCYDSSFYLSSVYISDTLMVDNIMLLNPNALANFPSDIFIAKWNVQSPVSIHSMEANTNSLVVVSNPVNNEFKVQSSRFTVGDVINIYDVLGNLVYTQQINHVEQLGHAERSRSIQSSLLKNGIYFLKVMSDDKTATACARFVVMH